jgi:hypothetical protein
MAWPSLSSGLQAYSVYMPLAIDVSSGRSRSQYSFRFAIVVESGQSTEGSERRSP